MLKGFKVKHVGNWFEFLKELDWASTSSFGTEIVPNGYYGYISSYFALFKSYHIDVYYPDKKQKKCSIEVLETDLEDTKMFRELDSNPFKKQKTLKEEIVELPKKGARFQIDWQKIKAYIIKHKNELREESYHILMEIKQLASIGLDFKVTKNKFFDETFDCYLIEINTIQGNYGPWNLSIDLLEEVRRMYGG